MGLAGKRALVTGGGRGIGAAIAGKLASAGAQVVVTARTRTEIEGIAANIGALALVADLSDRASTDALIGELEGGVDILVNNAGIAGSAPLARIDDALWDRLLEVNATAPFRLTRALVPGMVSNGWGRVINIASNAGVSGYAYTAAYCASKHALVGMTRALAVELARTGVTINAVCPGWVETRMVEQAVERITDRTGRSADEARSALASMSPQQRMITADEVAHLVVALCADDARGIHGQALVIDGGQILK